MHETIYRKTGNMFSIYEKLVLQMFKVISMLKLPDITLMWPLWISGFSCMTFIISFDTMFIWYYKHSSIRINASF